MRFLHRSGTFSTVYAAKIRHFPLKLPKYYNLYNLICKESGQKILKPEKNFSDK